MRYKIAFFLLAAIVTATLYAVLRPVIIPQAGKRGGAGSEPKDTSHEYDQSVDLVRVGELDVEVPSIELLGERQEGYLLEAEWPQKGRLQTRV